MKKSISFILSILMPVCMMAQIINVTFTGRDANNSWVRLNAVVITNQTKGWTETIYWPDTTLTMQNGTGIDETVANGGFRLSQNNPNPFSGTTDVNLKVADAGAVTLEIVDGNGKIVETRHGTSLQPGNHQFRITLSAAGTYVMTARQNGKTSSIKMVNNGGGKGNGIEYTGMVQTNPFSPKQSRGLTDLPFDFGDQMEYVGYATINGEECESQHISQVQETAETVVLQFTTTQDPFRFSTEDTVFIVCSPFCDFHCSSMSFNVTGFDNDAAITQPSDILGVGLKIEHSFIGDISITVVCPNSRSAQLMPYHSDNVGGVYPTYFGIENNTDENFSYCDASPNPPGTGWTYCWSEDSIYAQINGYCFLSENIGHDRERTVDSSHIAVGYPGDDNFVPGQQYYRPYESFSNLVGCPLNGLWEIQICDESGLDNGYVFGWEITFSPDLTGGPSSDLERACPGIPTVIDIDGNVYRTIQLGNQCWMRDNLRTTRYADSTEIPLNSNSHETSYTEPYCYVPNGVASYIHTYGFLYNWTAVMHGAAASDSNPSGVQGICPTGWHVPSLVEWEQLFNYVGEQSEYICGGNSFNIAKALASTTGWKNSSDDCDPGNNPMENNATGFSALLAGTTLLSPIGEKVTYVTTSEDHENAAHQCILPITVSYDSFYVYYSGGNNNSIYHEAKSTGLSVRCLKD